jgi:hypothetical protein
VSKLLRAAAFAAVLVVVALYVFTDNPLGAWLFFALGALELVIATVAGRGAAGARSASSVRLGSS